MREYTPEYESFREDALAVMNGAAVTIAVAGFWGKPVYLGPLALLVALVTYFMTPNSNGKTIIAVVVITLLALLVRWQGGYPVA